MASVIDAFDSTIKEAFSGLKVFVWALLFCICYNMKGSMMGTFLFVVVAIVFWGFLTEISYNIIKKDGKTLPGINMFHYGLVGVMSVLVLLPYFLLGGFIGYLGFTCINLPNLPVLEQTLRILCDFLAVSVVLAAYIHYARTLNPVHAYDIKKYISGFGETYLSFSFLLIKLSLVSVVVIGFLVYLFKLFIGFENSLWTFLMCVVSVFYIIISANYMAQISEEVYELSSRKGK